MMTVSIKHISVEVDQKAWANEYGILNDEVRPDVQTYIVEQLRNSSAGQAGLIQVTES